MKQNIFIIHANSRSRGPYVRRLSRDDETPLFDTK